MGRKSRLKRERAEAEAAARDDLPASTTALSTAAVVPTAPAPDVVRPAPRRRKSQGVGARVARVAVDDPTWEAFRRLCGSMPASVRLGQLVAAEVQRVHGRAHEPDAVAALGAIRTHVDELEAYVRGAATPR